MICFGHRGAAGYAPENTLASVEKAISLGADWVEVDVYAVENELVVIHDDRLERTTNGSGYIIEQSLEYLRSLDAGEGEKIPFLREIFDLVVELRTIPCFIFRSP
jgi:glycerophosphoryl diester phosphodiesterase